MEKHTPYLNVIKECSATLQTRGATLAECQDALEALAEMVESCDNGFEHCLLKDDKFKVGNRYDTELCHCCTQDSEE